jgi:hypothetical protein
MSVLFLSSFIFSQGKSSIQFTGGTVYPMSSSPGLSGTVQYNYNLNPRINLFISADYSAWDQMQFSYQDGNNFPQDYKTGYLESGHSLTRIMTGGRYIIVEPAQFKLFIEAGLGYSYLQYDSYNVDWRLLPDNKYSPVNTLSGKVTENLFNFSSGIGFIHSMTERWDILFEFKMNTYLNSHYYGLFSKHGTFTGFNGGFNYRI